MARTKKYLDGNDFSEELENISASKRFLSDKEKAFSDMITEQSPAEVETTGPETNNGLVVNALHVRVRKEPSLDAEVIAVLDKGTKVTILGTENGFYRIVARGIVGAGYIMAGLIKEG